MKMSPGVAAIISVLYFIFLVLRPSSALEVSRQEQLHLDAYPTVTYNLMNDNKAVYSQFMTELRNTLKAREFCGIPVTRNFSQSPEYVLVDLNVSTGPVTLAIRTNNVYLVAYRVGRTGKGSFLKESDVESAKLKLFDKNSTQRILTYDGSYGSIEKVTGDRKNLSLGLRELRNRVVALNKTVTKVEEAKFVLTAIQMVSEAARFKYIENLVVEKGFSASFRPNYTMTALQNNWGKISKAVYESSTQVPNQCIPVKPPIVIANKTWNLVSDIKIDVSLLLNPNSTNSTRTFGHQLFPKIVSIYINEAADIAGGTVLENLS